MDIYLNLINVNASFVECITYQHVEQQEKK